MVTYCISSSCFAAILEEEEALNIRQTVGVCLLAAGCRPWLEMEAELFDLEDRRLLIARPRSPCPVRLPLFSPRLHRR